jgi:RHS repeat-associated protein
VTVKDAAGLSTTATGKVKIDNTPPTITSFSGLPSNHELIDGQHINLKASAESKEAGIASIVLDIDGQQLGGSQGACSGSCTGHAEWTISGENYASGEHQLIVVATDNAGNVEKTEYHMVVHHPEGIAVEPGSVNPVTGELSLSATDVSINVPEGALTVSRSYRSRHLAQGTEGPLGPQWNLALGAQQSLYRVSGGMVLTGGNSAEVLFASKGAKGEFNSPTGDTGLTLLEKTVESKTIFTLSENGSVTTFELPAGSTGSVWMPSSTEGPNGTNTTLYKFRLKSGVIAPIEELAPVPAGVSCGKEISELKEGCRALKFEYDEGATTAKGEKASEWGEYAGHLSKVKYIAWNGSKTKNELVIAEYSYDIKGRLRAVWNPQIKPELKTIYGYDAEGHVTAVSTPGHEPLLLEQGTIPTDASSGRLLAVVAPSAGTALGSGEAPVNKEAPTLSSTTPKVGVKISVNLSSEKTPGKWSGGPLAFIYQWEDCNTSGKECTPILGAVNQAYYPVASDEGHKLVAEAAALNATGATTASSAATSTVASGTQNTPAPEPPEVGSDAVTTLEYQVPVSGSGAPYEMLSTKVAEWGQTDAPNEAMAVFPPDKVMGWPAKEYKRETVYYIDGKDRVVNTAASTGGISTTEYNGYNEVVRTLSPDNREAALKEGSKSAETAKLLSTESTYEEKGLEPGTELLSTLGPQHTVGNETKPSEQLLGRESTHYYYNETAPSEGGPYHLVTRQTTALKVKGESEKRTTRTSYAGQSNLGWKLRKPTSVTTPSSGLALTHTTEYSPTTGEVIETKLPNASGEHPTYLFSSQLGSEGTGNGQFEQPGGIAIDSSGNLWVLDTGNDRVEEFNSKGEYQKQFGFKGTGNGQFEKPSGLAIDSHGNIWVADSGNYRVQEFNSKGEYQQQFGFKGTGNGQFAALPEGIAIDAHGNVWVSESGGKSRVEVFNEKGEYQKTVGSLGEEPGQFEDPEGIAISKSNVWIVNVEHAKVEEYNEKGEYVKQFGVEGVEHGGLGEPFGITVESKGNILVTEGEEGGDRVQAFNEKGEYIAEFGFEKGEGELDLGTVSGVAADSEGHVWVTNTKHNDIEKWLTLSSLVGQAGANDTQTIYYTAKSEATVEKCRNHPEWANLPCQTQPAHQPETSSLPELPTTTYTYNIWNEPETTTETVGSTKRTKTNIYDEAGRLKSTAITSTVGTATPTVTYEYNKETGALEKQCDNEGKPCTEGHPKTITAIYNKLGELEAYTDAAEGITTHEYDIDGRTKKITDSKGTETKGTETFTYNTTTGLLSELAYENGTTKLTFTATYDSEGKLLTETYPNGMTATYTYNQVGRPTSLVYKKTTDCTEEEKEKCKWFKDTVVPSIRGEWLEQTSSFSHQTYHYDQVGRLTEVQNTPTGHGCTTRIYTYDEDTNRTSLTTREPAAEGKCATEGGKLETHTYDTADRLADTGTTYNTFGDITTLPADDAEASGEHQLTSTYYTDNQVASQTQKEQTVGYNLDPADRTLETISTGKPNNSTIINHYPGPANTPAWTENAVSHEWQRNITGISGSLVAIQNNGETPELQLTNLHGDIIAKAYLSETATELAAKADTSEYGVPAVSTPAKYSWLGAIQLPTELPSGVVNMGARSYVPQTGRFLQPDPIPGGSANAYAYTYGDPVNTNDPTGDYTATIDQFDEEHVSGEATAAAAARAAEIRAAEEAAARAAAEQAVREAIAEGQLAGPQYEEGGEEWEEWWEEEGGYEYVSDRHSAESGKEEHHIEPAILVQPLNSEESSSEGGLSAIPLCKAGSNGECARDAGGGGPACPPKSCKRKRYRSPCEISHGKGCSEHSTEPGKNIECAIIGGGIGIWNPAVGAVVGYACSEDPH